MNNLKNYKVYSTGLSSNGQMRLLIQTVEQYWQT